MSAIVVNRPPSFPFSKICVYCGASSGNRPEFTVAAEEMGKEIAGRGCGLVYGGGSVGLMGVVSRAAAAAGAHVLGVIPGELVCPFLLAGISKKGHINPADLHAAAVNLIRLDLPPESSAKTTVESAAGMVADEEALRWVAGQIDDAGVASGILTLLMAIILARPGHAGGTKLDVQDVWRCFFGNTAETAGEGWPLARDLIKRYRKVQEYTWPET